MSRLFVALSAVFHLLSGCTGPVEFYSVKLVDMAWREDGSAIYFIHSARGTGTNVYRVASTGGKPESINELYSLGVTFQKMDIRGNEMFLKGRRYPADHDLFGRKPPLMGGETVPLGGRPEHYVFHLDTNKAERIDLPETIAEPFAWSIDGGILYVSRPEGSEQGIRFKILEYNRHTGQSREIVSNVDPYRITLSPDRRKLAFMGSKREGLNFAGGAVVSVSATEDFQASYSGDHILGWLDNDAILVEISNPAGLYRRDLKTGQASPFSIQGSDSCSDCLSYVFPHLPTMRLAAAGRNQISTAGLDGSDPTVLVDFRDLPKGEPQWAF